MSDFRMPITIVRQIVEQNIREPFTLTIGIKVSDIGKPVKIIRCLPCKDLEKIITPQTIFPIEIKLGKHKNIVFKIVQKDKLQNGFIDIYFKDGPVFGIRKVKVILHPVHQFNGVYGLDFGSSRIAAAYLDPNNDDEPKLVIFPNDQNFIGSSFALELSENESDNESENKVEGSLFHGVSSSTNENVVFRPRQLIKKLRKFGVGTKNFTLMGGNKSIPIKLIDVSGFALASCFDKLDRCTPGAPVKITLPISTSFTPEDISTFKQSIVDADKMLFNMSARVNFHPDQKYILDEATAAAFYWIRGNQKMLLDKKKANFKLLVIDAGASSVDVSLLDLKLNPDGVDRLKVTPRIKAIDSFDFLSGDSVTALIANKLKDKELNPVDLQSLNTEEKFFRFQKFWIEAEDYKVNKVLEIIENKVLSNIVISDDEYQHILKNDITKFENHLREILILNENDDKHDIDHVLLTGGASLLEKMRICVQNFFNNSSFKIEIRTDGKEAVCKGAVLVAFYHDYAKKDFFSADSKSNLALDIDKIYECVPYSLLYKDGNNFNKIFQIGTMFKILDNEEKPLISSKDYSHQPVINFYRKTGGGDINHSNSYDDLQFLGSVELPTAGTDSKFKVVLFSNHEIEVRYDGKIYKPKNKDGIIEPMLNFMKELGVL